MQKTRVYYKTWFSSVALREAIGELASIARGHDKKAEVTLSFNWVWRGDESWSHDNIDEFLADADSGDSLYLQVDTEPASPCSIKVDGRAGASVSVSVQARDRGEIHRVFQVLDRHAPDSLVTIANEPVTIFIGHGRDPQWKQLKDHLHDQHGYDVEAYEIGGRAGMSVKEVLKSMLKRSSIAFLVLTGEDIDNVGAAHARENVIHELGLFQGKLGFERAIPLLEAGCQEFSNIFGITQIRFSKGNIRETFGDVVATIRREFEARD